ncbi:MAG: hypothetical protein POELPBGB_03600 [Bacteroidia bacterium]|nr:hypothetical protein [Bacteroidia bacterium]
MKKDKLFAEQVFEGELENEVIRNNMTIDYYYGHSSILEKFTEINLEFKPHLNYLFKQTKEDIYKLVQNAKSCSALIVTLMLTGKCNADCGICYTDRKSKNNELKLHEIKSVIDQAYELGVRTLYIPGEGEPTLDNSFWDILDYVKDKRMKIIVFTNGLLFSNDDESHRYWGISCEEAVKRLKKYPIYIYFKLWSLKPDLISTMMGINSAKYNYTNYYNWNIPYGLKLMLETLSLDKIGIEVIIEKRNLEEVVQNIIPFVQKSGVKSYMEPLIHSGRCFNQYDFDPIINNEQRLLLESWLQRSRCKRVGYMISIHNSGYLSVCMAISPKKISKEGLLSTLNLRSNGNIINELFEMLHLNEEIVKGRYKINSCICEDFNTSKKMFLSELV